MTIIPEIFIASSSEGNIASNAISARLEALGAGKVIIRHWTKQFQLSKVYIESLEDAVDNCDFGIFVLTADDLIKYRSIKSKAPRDNVIFELGLFMEGIGCSRCFIFVEKNKNEEVKTPTDLLGVETQEFTKPTGSNWATVVGNGCKKVLSQVFNEGKLYRLPENLNEYVTFRERIIGNWWNKANNTEPGSIAFVAFKADEAYNSIKIEGRSFSDDGKLLARWKSQIVSLIPK